jgi:hypothetical protein
LATLSVYQLSATIGRDEKKKKPKEFLRRTPAEDNNSVLAIYSPK